MYKPDLLEGKTPQHLFDVVRNLCLSRPVLARLCLYFFGFLSCVTLRICLPVGLSSSELPMIPRAPTMQSKSNIRLLHLETGLMFRQPPLLTATLFTTFQYILVISRLNQRHVTLPTLHVIHEQRVGPQLKLNFPALLILCRCLPFNHAHVCRLTHAWPLFTLLNHPRLILILMRTLVFVALLFFPSV